MTDDPTPDVTPEEEPARTRFAEPPPEAPPVPPAAASSELPPEVGAAVGTQAEVPAAASSELPPEVGAGTQAEVPAAASSELPPEVGAAAGTQAEVPAAASSELPPEVGAAARTQGGLTRWLGLLAVLLVLAVGVLSWQLVALSERPDADYRRTAKAALAAAKADAALVLAYDYRTLEAGFQKALKVTTDADGPSCKEKADRTSKDYDPKARCFRTEFTLTHQKVVTDLATRFKAAVVAEVGAAGVERVDGRFATVLLYVNQQSTNTQSASPKITQDRVEMTMEHVGGSWLVAGINAL